MWSGPRITLFLYELIMFIYPYNLHIVQKQFTHRSIFITNMKSHSQSFENRDFGEEGDKE